MMVIMDAKSGKVIATPPIGDRVDAAVFDPATGRAFSSNGDGTITVIGPQASGSGYEVVETIATQTGARTMAISLKTHHLYLPAAEYDSLPPPTPENPTPRRPIKPGSFVILEVAPVGR